MRCGYYEFSTLVLMYIASYMEFPRAKLVNPCPPTLTRTDLRLSLANTNLRSNESWTILDLTQSVRITETRRMKPANAMLS